MIYEAAAAICSLTSVSQRELAPAVTVLQLFLCSPKPCLRFAAVRTLNKVAMHHLPLTTTRYPLPTTHYLLTTRHLPLTTTH